MEIVTVEPSATAPDPDTLAESPESVILVADDSSKEASISRLEYSRLRAEASNAAATSSKLAYSTLFSDAFSSRTSAVDAIEGSPASVDEQPLARAETPLTVILADASIALESPERTVESQRQWIEGIQVEGQRMQGLVEDMLTLAKHDTAEVDAQATMSKQQEKLDVADMAQRAVLQFEAVAFERGVEINVAESSSGPVFIGGVRGDIERMPGILIDNACKYAEADGRVVVSAKREGKHAIVRVNNTGTPIPSSDLPHIFDRFWRADEARTSGAGGYGLGLSIARSIVEEHGGTLSAQSSAERGTTFTAKFPIKKD